MVHINKKTFYSKGRNIVISTECCQKLFANTSPSFSQLLTFVLSLLQVKKEERKKRNRKRKKKKMQRKRKAERARKAKRRKLRMTMEKKKRRREVKLRKANRKRSEQTDVKSLVLEVIKPHTCRYLNSITVTPRLCFTYINGKPHCTRTRTPYLRINAFKEFPKAQSAVCMNICLTFTLGRDCAISLFLTLV